MVLLLQFWDIFRNYYSYPIKIRYLRTKWLWRVTDIQEQVSSIGPSSMSAGRGKKYGLSASQAKKHAIICVILLSLALLFHIFRIFLDSYSLRCMNTHDMSYLCSILYYAVPKTCIPPKNINIILHSFPNNIKQLLTKGFINYMYVGFHPTPAFSKHHQLCMRTQIHTTNHSFLVNRKNQAQNPYIHPQHPPSPRWHLHPSQTSRAMVRWNPLRSKGCWNFPGVGTDPCLLFSLVDNEYIMSTKIRRPPIGVVSFQCIFQLFPKGYLEGSLICINNPLNYRAMWCFFIL